MSGAMMAMIAAGGAVFALPTAASDVSAGVDAVASLQFVTNGTFACQGNTLGVTQSGNWITPTALAPGAYTIRLHVNSGVTPVGPAVDTDHALSSNRTWTVTRSTVGTDTSTCTLTLKDGGGVTVATQSFTFTANRTV